MLEGLEVSEVLYSNTILNGKYNGRCESEFFKKSDKELLEKVRNKNYRDLGDFVFLTDGEHGNAITSPVGFAKYYGARNVLTGILNDNSVEYISKEHHKRIEKSKLFPSDILISCVGANIGFAAIVPPDIAEANIVRNVALIRSIDKSILNQYLLTYFLSKYGKSFFIRMATGNAQPLVSLDYIKTIPVFIPSFGLQIAVQNNVVNAIENLKLSQNTYSQSETLLLQEIGLQNFEPSKEPVNIKSFKESFGVTKRLDAEYYQKKYEQIIDKIKTQKHDSLINIVDISKSIEPGSDNYSDENGLPFYRVSDYNKFGLSKPDKELTNSFVADNKELIKKLKPKQGTILFSKDGSVGTAYLLRKDLDGITSGAILHLQIKNTKEIVPEYLTLALNSKLVQMQAERDAGGSIILHWRKEEIEQVVVPIIDYKKQEQIAELVEESFKLKAESERLLEVAKKAVEMAIEENEEKAMKYIKDNG